MPSNFAPANYSQAAQAQASALPGAAPASTMAAGPQMTGNPDPRMSAPMGQPSQVQTLGGPAALPVMTPPAALPQPDVSSILRMAPQAPSMGQPQPMGGMTKPMPFEGGLGAPKPKIGGGKNYGGGNYAPRPQPIAPPRDYR